MAYTAHGGASWCVMTPIPVGARVLGGVSKSGPGGWQVTQAGIGRETLYVAFGTLGHREVVAWPTWTWDREMSETRIG